MARIAARAVLAYVATVLAVVYGPALARYVAFGVLYGDWLNDWLTHLPEFVLVVVRAVIA